MNAGAYREKIVIEKSEYIKDEIGNSGENWKEYYKGYASVNNLFGKEYWEAAQVQAQNTVVFTVRHHKLLENITSRGYRLIHRGKIYDIISIDNMKYKNETVKIKGKVNG